MGRELKDKTRGRSDEKDAAVSEDDLGMWWGEMKWLWEKKILTIVIKGQARLASVTFPFPETKGACRNWLHVIGWARALIRTIYLLQIGIREIFLSSYIRLGSIPIALEKEDRSRRAMKHVVNRIPLSLVGRFHILKCKPLLFNCMPSGFNDNREPEVRIPVFHIFSYFDGMESPRVPFYPLFFYHIIIKTLISHTKSISRSQTPALWKHAVFEEPRNISTRKRELLPFGCREVMVYHYACCVCWRSPV